MSSQMRKQRQSNMPSKLLEDNENDILFQMTGQRCVVLATAIVQVLFADPPMYNKWNKRFCGVATFVKDNGKRSYFIRVFDIESRCMVWEQELYNQFDYKTLKSFFHTFDTDDCPAALNFCDEDEAMRFSAAIKDNISRRERKKAERQSSVSSTSGYISSSLTTPAPSKTFNINQPPAVSMSVSSTLDKSSKKKKDKKKSKIDKKDIGAPSNFVHVNHVGWDPEKGFDMNNLEPELKELFDLAGLDERHLKDVNTAKFIYNFIEEHGGVEAVKRQGRGKPAPPVPISQPCVPAVPPGPYSGGSKSSAPPPPPPPARGPAAPPPPPPPSRYARDVPAQAPPTIAPPPPPSRAPPVAPPPVAQHANHASPGNAPPPPPPPPPLGPMPPSLPAAPPSSSKPSFLSDIQKGDFNLNRVESSGSESPEPADERSTLMAKIRGGVQLKAVTQSESQARPEPESEEGIAGALRRAMAMREAALKAGCDDNDDDDDDEDEWDD